MATSAPTAPTSAAAYLPPASDARVEEQPTQQGSCIGKVWQVVKVIFCVISVVAGVAWAAFPFLFFATISVIRPEETGDALNRIAAVWNTSWIHKGICLVAVPCMLLTLAPHVFLMNSIISGAAFGRLVAHYSPLPKRSTQAAVPAAATPTVWERRGLELDRLILARSLANAAQTIPAAAAPPCPPPSDSQRSVTY